ncbi:hypothetical protein ACFYO0_03695 [Streptomyces sp. NPDC006365]|uniref:hypothetical protein n=1 Tax=Streptomyces sp. NPDC006365 TaxID=3364744 RepID=UPI0036C24041
MAPSSPPPCPAVGLLTACSATRAAPSNGKPVRGGALRVGVSGGSAKDTLDPHSRLSYPDQARVVNLYEPLFYHDADYRLKPFLAESIEPSKDGKTWLLKLWRAVMPPEAGMTVHPARSAP